MQVQIDQVAHDELWDRHDSWKQPYQPAKIHMASGFKQQIYLLTKNITSFDLFDI